MSTLQMKPDAQRKYVKRTIETNADFRRKLEEDLDEMDRSLVAEQLERGISAPLSFRDIVAIVKEVRAERYEEQQKAALNLKTPFSRNTAGAEE